METAPQLALQLYMFGSELHRRGEVDIILCISMSIGICCLAFGIMPFMMQTPMILGPPAQQVKYKFLGFTGSRKWIVLATFSIDIIGRWGPLAALFADPQHRPWSHIVFWGVPIVELVYLYFTLPLHVDVAPALIFVWMPANMMNIWFDPLETTARALLGGGVMGFLLSLDDTPEVIVQVYYVITACFIISNIGWICIFSYMSMQRNGRWMID